jgi:hypothetical protein
MLKLTLSACLAILPLVASAEGTPGAHFLENWDLDADGSVTLKEITERRGDVFFMFDQDENEVLGAKEYILFDETRAADMAENAGEHAQGNGGGRMQQGLTLGFNDIDEDGQVSRSEFLARSAAWFEIIDRNGDGIVAQDDFGPRSN